MLLQRNGGKCCGAGRASVPSIKINDGTVIKTKSLAETFVRFSSLNDDSKEVELIASLIM